MGDHRLIKLFTALCFLLTTSAQAGPAPGAAGNAYVSNGTQWVSAARKQSSEMYNVSYALSFSAGAMTIALKQSDGSTNCSTTSPCIIGFVNSRSAGGMTYISVTGALSMTVASTKKLGSANGVAQYYFVYAINNAGTVELAIAGSRIVRDKEFVTTTAVSSGTGGTTLYSTTARSNIASRQVGWFNNYEGTAGTWTGGSLDSVTTGSDTEPSGYVTEAQYNSAGGNASWTTTAGQYGDIVAFTTILPGAYLVSATCGYRSNGATTTTAIYCGIGTVTGNDATGLTTGQTQAIGVKNTTSGTIDMLVVPPYYMSVPTATFFYLKGRADTSNTNLQTVGGTLVFRRIQ